eukprot:CAMPEP_0204436282 /NCGR_PEP_ID=MMETSP0470-20130426/75174_1 /ASSEMBLY_ACC=CAM_ASM_000385 /TAXON_ID=2969 /ORGANISM="Oxyrrhis marina" /LENGTH=76 /DNA_ID=CAMNT_0051434911 /DNA_START=31 /DNA_END=258 /DNA_ORIENTATION=-
MAERNTRNSSAGDSTSIAFSPPKCPNKLAIKGRLQISAGKHSARHSRLWTLLPVQEFANIWLACDSSSSAIWNDAN